MEREPEDNVFDMQKYIGEHCVLHFDIDEEIAKRDNVVKFPVKTEPEDLIA